MARNDDDSGREAKAAVTISYDSECVPSVGAFPLFRHASKKQQQQWFETLANPSTNDSQSFQELLLARVPSYLYGEWYHNAAALLLTASLAFLASKLGLGLGVVLVACIALGVYYQASSTKFRLNRRNDIQRELAKMRIEADEEPVEWMNSFLQKFWLIFEPALCTMILENLDAVVGQYLPPFVESVRLTSLTLGTKPFRIESVKTYTDMDPKVVCMDWRVSFIPSDLSDLTAAERDKRVNPKIVINIHTTSQLKGIVIPAVLENIAFRGHMRVKIHFINKFPYARLFEASFLEKPLFDYELAPLGSNLLGFDINYIPGLQNFVRDQVHAILGPMMYAPNVFMFDVEQFFDGNFDISHANGILAVTVYSASSMDTANGDDGPFATAKKAILNPFIKFYVDDGRGELGRTSVQKDTFEPEWNETCFLLLNNLNNQLCFEANTQEDEDNEERIATGFFDLQELDGESHSIQEGLDLALYHKGKSMSDLKVDLRYFPVSKPTKRPDGTIEPAAQSNSAVLRLTVHECQDLAGPAKINPYVRVIVNGEEKIKTSIAWHTHNPAYEKAGEVVVLDKSEVFVRVEVKDWNKVHKDELLGVWTCYLSEILEKQEENDGWWPLTLGDDNKTGKLRLSAQWRPVVMMGLLDSTTGHGYNAPPIGVMRLTFWEARDLRNVEAVTAGKSDPYVRVLSGNQVRERTSVVDNNLSPEWGETLYVPVHSPKEDLTLEVMDWNAKTKDKHLGLVDLKTHELVKLFVGSQSENPDKWYDRSGVKIDQWAPLKSIDRKAAKGELRFTAEFYPTLALPQPRVVTPAVDDSQGEDDSAQIETTTVQNDLPIQDLHGAYIKYTPDNLIDLASYQCGVLRIKIHSVQLPKFAHAYCHVLADSLYPQYKTARAKGRELMFNEMSDVFIKEADVSRVAIEVRSAMADEKDDTKLGYWVDSLSSIVRYIQRQRRMQPDLKIEDDHGEWFELFGATEGRIRLSFDFVPMSNFELSPDESIGNQGNLTVTLLRANNLKAADKSGTSDPYVVFTVNGDRVHKSATIKKTLDPVWKNEQFTVPIQSRVTSSFRIEVFDWNQIKGDEPIGSGGITLRGDMVESFAAKEVAIPLDGAAGVTGSVHVRFLWQPQLLTKRKTQTTILSTTRMMTSTTMKGAGAGGGIRTATSVSSLGLSESASHSRTASVESGSLLGDTDSLVASLDEGEISSATGQAGHIKLTLVEARGLHGVDKSGTSGPYVRVRLGKKTMKTQTIMKTLAPTWNETFTQSVTEQPTVLSLKIMDYNKFSRAVTLGECRWNIWDLIQPDQPKIDRWLPLNPLGSGEIHIVIEFFST